MRYLKIYMFPKLALAFDVLESITESFVKGKATVPYVRVRLGKL